MLNSIHVHSRRHNYILKHINRTNFYVFVTMANMKLHNIKQASHVNRIEHCEGMPDNLQTSGQ